MKPKSCPPCSRSCTAGYKKRLESLLEANKHKKMQINGGLNKQLVFGDWMGAGGIT
jgi:hypothetical protein